MIEVMSESNGLVLALKATGILTNADYREILTPKLEEILEQFGSVRVVLVMTQGCYGWQFHSPWTMPSSDFNTEEISRKSP